MKTWKLPDRCTQREFPYLKTHVKHVTHVYCLTCISRLMYTCHIHMYTCQTIDMCRKFDIILCLKCGNSLLFVNLQAAAPGCPQAMKHDDFPIYSCHMRRRLLSKDVLYCEVTVLVNALIYTIYSSQCAVYFEMCGQPCQPYILCCRSLLMTIYAFC